MNKTSKEELAGTMKEVFANSKIGFLVDYRGMNMEEIDDLRRKLHHANSTMRVLKNRVTKLAAKGTSFEPLANDFVETRAFIYGDEPVAPAKVITDFIKANNKLKFVRAFLTKDTGGDLLSEAQVKQLANLPSREELLGKLLFVMNATTTNFVRTLNEVPTGFVRVLAATAEKKSA